MSPKARLIGAIVVLLVVGLALRSCIPSRTVGHGAVEEACFAFWRAVQLPSGEPTYAVLERSQDAATRSQDPTLAADVSRATSTYGEDGTGGPLTPRVVDGALAQCAADGWAKTDQCTYGAAVCRGAARAS
jgi:hypothetical protein